MSSTSLAILLGLLAAVALGALAYRPLRRMMLRRQIERALKRFKVQREQLEAQFFQIASRGGKPRGLRWLECDWQDAVRFGRDLRTGQLAAFVAVNIRFEAIEGGDMEDVEAVGMIRDAAAVFHYQAGRWEASGRALFNMNPSDALDHLRGQVEPVEV